MTNIHKIFFIFFLTFSFNSYAEIYYVDMDKIMNHSEPGKYINKKIQESNLKKNNEFKLIRNSLKKKEEQLINQKNILNEKEFNKKLENLKKEFEEYNVKKQYRIEDQKKNLINYKSKLIKLIEPILIDYMKENNINYLLRKKNILVGRDDYNKTDEIILLVNNKINNSSFND